MDDATNLARVMDRLKLDLTSGEVLETTLALKLNSTFFSVLNAKTNVSPSGKCAEMLCFILCLMVLTAVLILRTLVLIVFLVLRIGPDARIVATTLFLTFTDFY